MWTFETNKLWIILVFLSILIFGTSSCMQSLEITDIPELPVRTLASPTANQFPEQEIVEEVDPEDNIYCKGDDVHPIGENISQTYDVTYEEVIRLYCSGFSFDNILLAFATSQQTDYEYNPRELLQMRLAMSWDEIWNEIGFFENK